MRCEPPAFVLGVSADVPSCLIDLKQQQLPVPSDSGVTAGAAEVPAPLAALSI